MGTTTNIIIVVVVVLLVFWIIKGGCSEGYGQDASIRASAGWIAGPNYGFDPVQQYADQIQALRDQDFQKEMSRENYGNAKPCNSCMSR
jgi:hypothetical protein